MVEGKESKENNNVGSWFRNGRLKNLMLLSTFILLIATNYNKVLSLVYTTQNTAGAITTLERCFKELEQKVGEDSAEKAVMSTQIKEMQERLKTIQQKQQIFGEQLNRIEGYLQGVRNGK